MAITETRISTMTNEEIVDAVKKACVKYNVKLKAILYVSYLQRITILVEEDSTDARMDIDLSSYFTGYYNENFEFSLEVF